MRPFVKILRPVVYVVLSYLQGEAVDLKPVDAQVMLPVDRTPVSLLLDGTHVGRGSEW